MGQVLYRKYRSKSFGEIVGQEHITKTLERAISGGNFSHAYLLTGPRGTGKTSIARILAHAVNSLPYSDESIHLDIIEIDAASNRRIDEIRELRDKVHIAPASAKYKVYIIDEVHMLTREAMAALLKTLEEPPEHVIFIMATTEAHKLPETIISRTQRFTFRPIESKKVIDHLRSIAKKEKIDISDDALQLIAEHGGGSFRDSISLLDQTRSIDGKIEARDVLTMLGQAPSELIDKLEQAIQTGDKAKAIEILHNLSEQGYEPARIAKQLGQTIRQHLLDNASSDSQSIELIGRLIDVPGSADPAIALELAVLKNFAQDDHKSTAPTADKLKSEPVIQPAPSENEKIAQKSEVPKDEVNPNSPTVNIFDKSLWPKVLEVIKQKHSTLYAVARMAKPGWDDGVLTLEFKFSFHQKAVNNSKNRQILIDTIKVLTGEVVSVECILNEELEIEQKPEKSTEKDEDSDLDTISNIFGAAELLES